jgi:hypothetical protein
MDSNMIARDGMGIAMRRREQHVPGSEKSPDWLLIVEICYTYGGRKREQKGAFV